MLKKVVPQEEGIVFGQSIVHQNRKIILEARRQSEQAWQETRVFALQKVFNTAVLALAPTWTLWYSPMNKGIFILSDQKMLFLYLCWFPADLLWCSVEGRNGWPNCQVACPKKVPARNEKLGQTQNGKKILQTFHRIARSRFYVSSKGQLYHYMTQI